MWDVSDKEPTVRVAIAKAVLRAGSDTIRAVREGRVPKGDPLPVAKVAAVMAAKNTPQMIPYCHPLPVESVKVEFEVRDDAIEVTTQVKTSAKTGVEMEALAAASMAVLTLYDMLKQIDMGMTIEDIRLLSKTGGKSDYLRS
jgi:cyclic pyranopterin monophosphate synthase